MSVTSSTGKLHVNSREKFRIVGIVRAKYDNDAAPPLTRMACRLYKLYRASLQKSTSEKLRIQLSCEQRQFSVQVKKKTLQLTALNKLDAGGSGYNCTPPTALASLHH
ncbi:hypothetical protein CBL_03136 [Carabus blaptoides fortunei]